MSDPNNLIQEIVTNGYMTNPVGLLEVLLKHGIVEPSEIRKEIRPNEQNEFHPIGTSVFGNELYVNCKLGEVESVARVVKRVMQLDNMMTKSELNI